MRRGALLPDATRRLGRGEGGGAAGGPHGPRAQESLSRDAAPLATRRRSAPQQGPAFAVRYRRCPTGSGGGAARGLQCRSRRRVFADILMIYHSYCCFIVIVVIVIVILLLSLLSEYNIVSIVHNIVG